MTELLDYAERVTRAEIARWPAGTYRFTDHLDSDGFSDDPVPLTVALTIHDDGHLTCDWTGSSPQVKAALNSTLSFTRSCTYLSVRSVLRQDVPNNAGVFRCIDVIAPEGTILNPRLPGACAARALTGYRMLDVMLGALAQALPDRVPAAGEGGNTVLSFGGLDARHRPFVIVDMITGAWGGRPDKDGMEAVTNASQNMSNTPGGDARGAASDPHRGVRLRARQLRVRDFTPHAPLGRTAMKATVNGIAVNYTLEGPANAPVVTMSHSLATDLSMWDPTVPALTGRFRVLRYETRGHGKTDAPKAAYTLDQLADDALALLKSLGIQKTHWVGLSMGGMIGQTLALKAPEVFASLSLCDTSSRMPAEAKGQWADRIKTAETQGMEPLVEPTLARWFTEPFRKSRKEVIDRVATMIRTTPAAGYAGCCHAISALDLTDRIGAIKIPTIAIVGEDDPGTPVAAHKVIHEKIAGSKLEILKSAAHLSNMEQPEAFNKALTGFLTSVA